MKDVNSVHEEYMGFKS